MGSFDLHLKKFHSMGRELSLPDQVTAHHYRCKKHSSHTSVREVFTNSEEESFRKLSPSRFLP